MEPITTVRFCLEFFENNILMDRAYDIVGVEEYFEFIRVFREENANNNNVRVKVTVLTLCTGTVLHRHNTGGQLLEILEYYSNTIQSYKTKSARSIRLK